MTIEKTSKALKKAQLQWVSFFTVAVLILIVGVGVRSSGATIVGVLSTLTGFGGLIITGMRTWWQHG